MYNTETANEKALEFLFSMRGRYIVSQALYHALKVMEKVQPEAHQEKSNMDDMEYLRETLFNFPDLAFEESLVTEASSVPRHNGYSID